MTADVNVIEDNIRNLFPDPEPEEEEQQDQFANVPQEIMDAAFQEEDQDDPKT